MIKGAIKKETCDKKEAWDALLKLGNENGGIESRRRVLWDNLVIPTDAWKTTLIRERQVAIAIWKKEVATRCTTND